MKGNEREEKGKEEGRAHLLAMPSIDRGLIVIHAQVDMQEVISKGWATLEKPHAHDVPLRVCWPGTKKRWECA